MRFRMYPTPAQEAALFGHCTHARFVWNLGHEQRLMWRPGRGPTPGYAEQDRQLTEARAAEPWLAAGSSTVQQQALRDLDRAWRDFFAGTHRRPGWRKAGRHEGFRVVGGQARRVRQVNRRWAQALVPKVGWVRFRRTRGGYDQARSYRVTRDRAGRWHIAFAVVPEHIPGPGAGTVVGLDLGVTVSLATSDGMLLSCPRLRPTEAKRLLRLQRRASRQRARGKPPSNRLRRTYAAIARLRARDTDRRKDWAEQTSTALARCYDLIRIEDLRIPAMTRSARGTYEAPGRGVRQKAGLNSAILSSGWGLLTQRLEHKAKGRVERISAAYTSLTCAACGHVAAESRESQARFVCVVCGHIAHADVNAACNIAAGRAVTARGALPSGGAVNREPQHAASVA